jgi:Flp pilus assembly protein TadB
MRRQYVDPSDLTLLQALGLPGAGSGTRASDAERERAAEALRRHHADGRLDTEELEERTERVYAAKTLGDLDRQFTDLPRLRSPEREQRPRRLRLWPPAFAFPFIALLFVVAVVASASAPFFIWPLMLFLFFRFGFMRRRWRGRARRWPEASRHY